MPNTLKRQYEPIENYYWLRQTYSDGIPADCKGVFYYHLNELTAKYKEMIDDVISSSGSRVVFPMDTDYLTDYFTGYDVQYIGFSGGQEIEGYWEADSENDSLVYIFYNTDSFFKRQRFTKIHETFHFAQSIDPWFMCYFDDIIENSTLPGDVIYKLMEKSADKATAMYLMPNEYFLKKYKEVGDIDELSSVVQVSKQSVRYRLKECGQII